MFDRWMKDKLVFSGENSIPRAPHFVLVYTCCWRECPKQHDALFFYIYQRGQTIAVVCPFETPTRRFRPHIDLLR